MALRDSLTLEEWRRREHKTYMQLAHALKLADATQARRYARGIRPVPVDIVERTIRLTKGDVGPQGLHRARLKYVRSAGTR